MHCSNRRRVGQGRGWPHGLEEESRCDPREAWHPLEHIVTGAESRSDSGSDGECVDGAIQGDMGEHTGTRDRLGTDADYCTEDNKERLLSRSITSLVLLYRFQIRRESVFVRFLTIEVIA